MQLPWKSLDMNTRVILVPKYGSFVPRVHFFSFFLFRTYFCSGSQAAPNAAFKLQGKWCELPTATHVAPYINNPLSISLNQSATAHAAAAVLDIMLIWCALHTLLVGKLRTQYTLRCQHN